MKNNSGHTTEEIKEFFPFEKAREYVRKLGMKGSIEYREWASSEEKPDYIPVHPDRLDDWCCSSISFSISFSKVTMRYIAHPSLFF